SVGAGGYYLRYTGNIEEEASVNGSVSKVSSDYDLARQSTHDAGLILRAGFNLPFSPVSALMIDGRYTLGLVDQVTTPDIVSHFNDLQALVGLRWSTR
ncbi:MAG: hypothetical protein AB1540_17235, partial [Bdellovibrionota bacterium]